MDVINDGQASVENSDCSEEAFYQGFPADVPPIAKPVDPILKSIPPMPAELEAIYISIGNPNVEYYIGSWVLLSLKTIQSRWNARKRKFADFALHHVGMGHTIICSYNSCSKKVFFRRDGGSNFYERTRRSEFMDSYEPTRDNEYDIKVWFDKVKNQPVEEPWLQLRDTKLIN